MKSSFLLPLFVALFLGSVEGKDEGKAEAAFELAAGRDPNAANPSVENFYLNPYAFKNLSKMGLKEFAKKNKLMQQEFTQYLVDQITMDDDNQALPGQRVCLPLIVRDKRDLIHPSFTYHSFIYQTVKEITAGTFVQNLFRATDVVVPTPKYHRIVNYNSDKDYFIDMGPDFTLTDGSFTVSATVRLRGNMSRGGRILSKRDRNHDGWELVLPSYYGRQLSFYSSPNPGHLDYGQTYLPEDVWSTVGLVFDRDSYPNNIVKVTAYIDGYKDGEDTLIDFTGVRLHSVANLTVGLGRREDGRVAAARIDYHEPEEDWKSYSHQFFGDIKEFSIWHKALNRQQMRRHSGPQLRKLRPKKLASNCGIGWASLDCNCYKVFNNLVSYKRAQTVCANQGGTLAMPKTDRIQSFLEFQMQRYKTKEFWFGMSDIKIENTYVWADGSVFNFRKHYHKFIKGKPDKDYKTEDCFEQLKTKNRVIWNDDHCLKLNAFICETPDTATQCF